MQLYKGTITTPGRSEKTHAFEVPDGEKPVVGTTPPLCDRKKRRLGELSSEKPLKDVSTVTCGVCRFTVEKRKKTPSPKSKKPTKAKVPTSAPKAAPAATKTPLEG